MPIRSLPVSKAIWHEDVREVLREFQYSWKKKGWRLSGPGNLNGLNENIVFLIFEKEMELSKENKL